MTADACGVIQIQWDTESATLQETRHLTHFSFARGALVICRSLMVPRSALKKAANFVNRVSGFGFAGLSRVDLQMFLLSCSMDNVTCQVQTWEKAGVIRAKDLDPPPSGSASPAFYAIDCEPLQSLATKFWVPDGIGPGQPDGANAGADRGKSG